MKGVLLLEDLDDEDSEFIAKYQSSTQVFGNQKAANRGIQRTRSLEPPSTTSDPKCSTNFQGMSPIPNGAQNGLLHPPPRYPHPDSTINGFHLNGYHAQVGKSQYSPYHSPSPPPGLQLGPGGGYNHISKPTTPRNNAIILAPSRNSLLEPNVFTGERHQSHHHHKKHHHRKHKGRSKTPPVDGDILSKIDNSIRKNFGDWNNMEEDNGHRSRIINNTPNPSNKHTPYYIPRKREEDCQSQPHDNFTSLPKLYKNYDSIMSPSAMGFPECSKDNNDPNSILSEAKRTLSQCT